MSAIALLGLSRGTEAAARRPNVGIDHDGARRRIDSAARDSRDECRCEHTLKKARHGLDAGCGRSRSIRHWQSTRDRLLEWLAEGVIFSTLKTRRRRQRVLLSLCMLRHCRSSRRLIAGEVGFGEGNGCGALSCAPLVSLRRQSAVSAASEDCRPNDRQRVADGSAIYFKSTRGDPELSTRQSNSPLAAALGSTLPSVNHNCLAKLNNCFGSALVPRRSSSNAKRSTHSSSVMVGAL